MQYKIIVDKQPSSNPSDEIKEYVIDIEELRIKGDIYDSLVITKGEDYVMRRLELTKYHKLNVLDTPIKQPLTDLNIELFEGDNYIYLMDMTGNKFYAEYLVKNDFTDMYVTRNEMNSSINQTASQIELSVNQKLTGYSTTKEMNAAIDIKANEITSSVNEKFEDYDTSSEVSSKIEQKANSITSTVSNTYETKTNATTNYSKLTQTANSLQSQVSANDKDISTISQTVNEVNIEVGKKYNTSDFTNAKITAKINDGTSAVQISANKVSLAGKTINMTSDNIAINSTNFKVDKNGKVTCSDIDVTGGKIDLISKQGSGNFIVRSDNAICDVYGDLINIAENNATNIPAQVSVGVQSGEAKIDVINRELSAYTAITGSGIETPKLTQTSLKSKKKNIKKLKVNALELIKNSDICLYNLKGEKAKSKKHIGLVIGEGYNCPEEVISEDRQGVEQYSMTSLAWKAIQEQQEIIQKLNKRIEELEAK